MSNHMQSFHSTNGGTEVLSSLNHISSNDFFEKNLLTFRGGTQAQSRVQYKE